MANIAAIANASFEACDNGDWERIELNARQASIFA